MKCRPWNPKRKVDNFQNRVAAEEREVARLEAQASSTIAGSEAQLRRAIETNLRGITDLDREIEQIDVRSVGARRDRTDCWRGLRPQCQPRQCGADRLQAKPLLKIVPQDQLQAKVYVPNSAIGFIQPGQRADVGRHLLPTR